MISRLFLAGLLVVGIPLHLFSQQTKEIPVYPNARLDTEGEEGETPQCCSFKTEDQFSKVIAFYESTLKTKAMDIQALAAKYPELKQQFGQMQELLPPGSQWRGFVLGESGSGPTRGISVFEVHSMDGVTSFTIEEEQLGASRTKWRHEFDKATGVFEQLARNEEEEFKKLPLPKAEEYNIPVYPGGRIGHSQYLGKTCYKLELTVQDSFEKVVAFYREKLKGQFRVEAGLPANEFRMVDEQFSERLGEGENPATILEGKKGAVNRKVDIYMPAPTDQDPNEMQQSDQRYVYVVLESKTLDGGNCTKTLYDEDVQIIWNGN